MNEFNYTNNLIKETSPYLLQHAHNPVNWFAWGEEALQKAKKENKPILVSIGYAACHWCHVMEHESFEDEETASIMNEYFVNIKIDREERPDIDHIYMDAVQAITGTGGWPLNVFLTPDLKPFFGGTYFPPKPISNRSSWQQVLAAVATAYREKKDEVIQQAEHLTDYLRKSNSINLGNETINIKQKTTEAIAANLLKLADKQWGGFGQAPKFPQTFSIIYLLRQYFFTKNRDSLDSALLSLDKMMTGGIYDHLGGGFCRYSTDSRWQIPHFEKMLYDNALLTDAYTEAYQLTKKEKYATVVEETIRFIKKELTSPEGGFYCALDADSEGVEGKYYIWQKNEIEDILGDEANLFCMAFNISEEGNWEHTNILWMPEDLDKVADKAGINKDVLQQSLGHCKKRLLTARKKRVRPALDNKVLLSWNALTVISLCKAYAAFGKEEYLEFAKTNVMFIEKHLFNTQNASLFHSWNKTTNPQLAFLDDFATLIEAYIYLHQVTANTDNLLKAKLLTEKAIEIFGDEKDCFFYFTSKDQADVLLRKPEIYDGATPSGNAVMAANLILLSVFFDIPQWRQRAEEMVAGIMKFSEKHPISFGRWNLNLMLLIYGFKEIVVMAEDYRHLLQQILQEYIPFKIVQASEKINNEWPLLQGKLISPNQTKIYICENYNCLQPAASYEEFKNQLINNFDKKNSPTK